MPRRKTEQILLHIFRCRLVHYCEIFRHLNGTKLLCDIIQHPADIPGSHAPNFMDILCFSVTSIRTHLVNVNSNPKSFTPHIIFACSKNIKCNFLNNNCRLCRAIIHRMRASVGQRRHPLSDYFKTTSTSNAA